jgi:hypothetical protein
MMPAARTRAERLITVIRARAFDELERERGELAPMALTMDDAGRIGVIAVYTGDTFPDPDNHLADLMSTVKAQVAMHGLESAALAHRESARFPNDPDSFDSVCVHFETRNAKPLRIYFPYRIKKKLRGRSEITLLAPVTTAGTHVVFEPRVNE